MNTGQWHLADGIRRRFGEDKEQKDNDEHD
jgi:hypothetical protein